MFGVKDLYDAALGQSAIQNGVQRGTGSGNALTDKKEKKGVREEQEWRKVEECMEE